MHAFVRIVLPRHWARSPQLLTTATERSLEQEMENDRTVVVSGDGAEDQSQMAEFAASQEESEAASWVPSPLWHKGSKSRKEEELEYLADLALEDIPELQLSPLNTFAPNPSPMLSRPCSQPLFPTSTDSIRELRRIQSTSSLAALHLNNTQEMIACPPPTTFPPSSPIHTFHFNTFSHPSTSPRVKQSHRRSKSSTQVPRLISSDQQHCIYPLYSPSPPWTMSRSGVLMMAGRRNSLCLAKPEVLQV
jgi:hypothetical protein